MKCSSFLFAAAILLTAVAATPASVGAQSALPPATEATPLSVVVPASDTYIRYVGRFDKQDPTGPRCSWSASRVVLRFNGSDLNARLNDEQGNNSYAVVLDGVPQPTLKLQKGLHLYSIVRGAKAAPHTVELVRRTEGFCGVTQFAGYQLSAGGKMLAPPAPAKHRIEVIGDSISCGYGDEGKTKEEHFIPDTENAYLTYGSIASRAVGADYVCVAWSGRKMHPDNTMDEVYGRTLAADPSSKWDFAKWTPDVVVVTLGTNDLNGGIKDPKAWIAGYRAFLAKVHKNYPKAAIYCATSPMAWGDQIKLLNGCLGSIVAEEQAAGYKNVRLLPFATQEASDGYGSDWHPNVTTQKKMAKVLTTALSKDLGWKATP